jgi:hypothetical protein
MGIFTAPEPHFMLHCTKCSLRQTLSVNQTNCHRSGHDRIIGEVRFLAQQRKILVLVIVVVKFIRPNRITISAGTSGFLLPFCSAAISGIMPQKASFLRTFSTNCHILLDIVPFRVYNKGTRKPMTQNEAIEDKTERGKLHSPIKVPKWYRSLGNETSPAPGGKDKTERGKLYSPTAVSK